jgi:coenzyme F420-reducing hydrogenase alpha subunit
MSTRTIQVDQLARVEGEGALHIRIKDNAVQDVKLRIFEPPRFFEAVLRGRAFTEAPDITARICGICPVAYQMCAVQAMEDACGVTVGGPLRALRRLLYCGEYIESHALHIYLLHAPDFLGYQDAISMARDHPEAVQRGLRLKKIGNAIVSLLGGREIHPINVRVGGFYRVPTPRDLAPLAEQLKWARDAAQQTVAMVSKLSFAEFEFDYEFVALQHPEEYAVLGGRLVSNKGLDIAVCEYDQHFAEEHVSHTTALQSRLRERGAYQVGPLARYNLSYDKLSPLAQDAARTAGLGPRCTNPFQSIVVRSVELLHACDEALRIIEQYEMPDSPAVPVEPRAGTGYACTEAPRGTLYHRYSIDQSGTILEATIIPPTAQNQKTIEGDLKRFLATRINLPDDQLTWQCEQAVRNYDPCISCSTHFLRLELERV